MYIFGNSFCKDSRVIIHDERHANKKTTFWVCVWLKQHFFGAFNLVQLQKSGRVALGNVTVLHFNHFFKRLRLGRSNSAPSRTCRASSLGPCVQCYGDFWVTMWEHRWRSGPPPLTGLSVLQLSPRQEESWLDWVEEQVTKGRSSGML